MIENNIKILFGRIEKACNSCGRNKDDVKLIAVSKTFSAEHIRQALSAGLNDFGENYVQELEEKRQLLQNEQIRWHFTGHLQSNKVKYLADYISLIHSVDSLSLAKEISKRASSHKRIQDILVEVHTTDEATKFGVMPEKTVELVKAISLLPNINLCGLMTIGPFSDNADDSRKSFRILSDLKSEVIKNGINIYHLSMGMTHDFEVAIEEGSTIVRIGTAIFGTRSLTK